MELLVVVLVACVLAIPIVAIVALARTGSLRDELRQQSDRVLNLELELSALKRDVARAARGASQGQAQPMADAATRPAPSAAPPPAAVAAPAVEQSPAEAAYPVRTAIEGFVYRQHDAAAAAAGTETETIHPARQVPPAVAPHQAELDASQVARDQTPVTEEPPVAASSRPESQEQKVWTSPVVPAFAAETSYAPTPSRRPWRERLGTALPLEELLGMNFFAKIGIVLLVLGVAFWGRLALATMGPVERVAMTYAVAAAMLGAGVWFEPKERYRLVGRMGIGGGWALLFFTTYAMHNVSPMTILASSTLDCLLMLLVAAGMVGHTRSPPISEQVRPTASARSEARKAVR